MGEVMQNIGVRNRWGTLEGVSEMSLDGLDLRTRYIYEAAVQLVESPAFDKQPFGAGDNFERDVEDRKRALRTLLTGIGPDGRIYPQPFEADEPANYNAPGWKSGNVTKNDVLQNMPQPRYDEIDRFVRLATRFEEVIDNTANNNNSDDDDDDATAA